MQSWVQRLLFALLLLVPAPAAWATLSANSRLGENLQAARVLRVEFSASGELHQDSSGSCGWTTAECSVAPSNSFGIGIRNVADSGIDLTAVRAPLADVSYIPRAPDVIRLGAGTPPGSYIYTTDVLGTTYVRPNVSGGHAGILGNGSPALGAGELTVSESGTIGMFDNTSGLYRFPSTSLPGVQSSIESQGMVVDPGALKAFKW